MLKPLIALALLGLVAWMVPWKDRVIWTRGPVSHEVVGEVLGDWKEDEVIFRFETEPGAEPLLERLPAPLADALGAARASTEDPELEPGDRIRIERPPVGFEPTPEDVVWDWRPGMPRVFSELDVRGLGVAFLWLLGGILCVVTRWWRLLNIAGCSASWWQSLRLTWLGLFFNIIVPGLTGGDVIKAVLVVREHPERKSHAFVSVFVDRLIGLLALALLCAAVILIQGETFADLRIPVLLFLAAGVIGGAVYATPFLRRLVRYDAWVDRLPLGGALRQLDEATLLYSRHPVQVGFTLLISFANHFCVILGIVALGRAFGDAMPLGHYFAVVPVANTVTALPLSPGGWGLGEAAYRYLFELVGYSGTIGVAVSITFRLCMMALGILGGLFLLAPGNDTSLAEMRALPKEEEPA